MPGARMFMIVTMMLIAPRMGGDSHQVNGEDRHREAFALLAARRRVERPAVCLVRARHEVSAQQQQERGTAGSRS